MPNSVQTHGGMVYTEFRHAEVSTCPWRLPSSAEEGWTRRQRNYREATSHGADGVVLVKRYCDAWPTPPRLRD